MYYEQSKISCSHSAARICSRGLETKNVGLEAVIVNKICSY